MTEQPRASSFKVALAILAVPLFTFMGCSLFATDGRGYTGRGAWEFNALGALVIAGVLAFYCYSLAFKKGPSFSLHDDRIEHFSWKKPIYFRDVEEVVLERSGFSPKPAGQAYLRLKNGSRQYIPVFLMSHGPEEFARVVQEALERYRAAHPPLS